MRDLNSRQIRRALSNVMSGHPLTRSCVRFGMDFTTSMSSCSDAQKHP